MAQHGWYPDPDGTPNRFRYWDGIGWSSETTFDPHSPPPAARRPAGRSRTPLVIGALVVLLIIAVIGVLIIRSHGSTAVTDPDPPASTVSGWDDSRPLPTATPSPSAATSRPQARVACARGNPLDRAAHPQDGRVHGGRLSFADPPGAWERRPTNGSGMSFAYDVQLIDQVVEQKWWASLAVGEVRRTDGFVDPQQAATAIMQCISTSDYYRGITGTRRLATGPVTVGDRQGWRLRAEIRVDDPEVRAEGDVVEIRVVDTGDPDALSFFWGCAPIGDTQRIRTMDATVGTLKAG